LALIAPPESNRHLERTQDREVMVASFRLEAESRSRRAAVRQLAKVTDRGRRRDAASQQRAWEEWRARFAP